MLKKQLIALLFTLSLQSLLSIDLYAQKTVTTLLKNFTMCRINSATGNQYDCKNQSGALLYTKVDVLPNKYIIVYPKNFPDDSKITVLWDKSKLSMNTDRDLYIYDYLTTDMNKPGGSSIQIVMRLDYSIDSVIYFINYEGQINKFTMFEK